MADWPIIHTLFGDRLPAVGDDVIISYDGPEDSRLRDAIGTITSIHYHGEHAFMIHTDKRPDGYIASRLSRWRLA